MATLGMLVLAFMLQNSLPDNPVMRVVLLVSGAGAGWILPGFFLEKQIKKRHEVLRLAMPDMLDMLVVSVEAGLGTGPGDPACGARAAIRRTRPSRKS